VPKDPIAEETLWKEHGTNQDIEDGEEGNQDPDSAAQKVTRDENGEIIEVEDEGDFLDEIGPKKSHDKNEGDKEFFKMFYDVLLDFFHNFSLSPIRPREAPLC
jgi:hypothetical protein